MNRGGSRGQTHRAGHLLDSLLDHRENSGLYSEQNKGVLLLELTGLGSCLNVEPRV